jgi:hypothetical protein
MAGKNQLIIIVKNVKRQGVKLLEGVGRVYQSGRSLVVRIPVDVVRDSTFPFKENQLVNVQIIDGELKISKFTLQ